MITEMVNATIARFASHRLAVPVMVLYGFIGTVVEIVPVTWVLSAFVAFDPKRWKKFLIAGSIGASGGAMLLTWVFHRWGLAWVNAHYPTLVGTSGWQSIETWVASYGVVALAGVAASPLALTPALAACGLMKMPLTWAGLAVFAGKTLKYAVVTLFARRASSAAWRFSASSQEKEA